MNLQWDSTKPNTHQISQLKAQEGNLEDHQKKKIKRKKTVLGNTMPVTDTVPETMVARKKWNNSFQMQKEKNCQPRILYPEIAISEQSKSNVFIIKAN